MQFILQAPNEIFSSPKYKNLQEAIKDGKTEKDSNSQLTLAFERRRLSKQIAKIYWMNSLLNTELLINELQFLAFGRKLWVFYCLKMLSTIMDTNCITHHVFRKRPQQNKYRQQEVCRQNIAVLLIFNGFLYHSPFSKLNCYL